MKMIVNKIAEGHDRTCLEVTVQTDELNDLITEVLNEQKTDGRYQKLGIAGTPAQSIDFADEQVQNYLKHHILARLEKRVLDNQTPSPITRPIIAAEEDVDLSKPFFWTITYLPLPQFELTSYEPVEITMPDITVTSTEISQAIEEIVKESLVLVEEDYNTPITADNTIEVSIDAKYLDSTPCAGLIAQRRQYKIGEGFLPQEFDNALLGMRQGELKTFTMEIPSTAPAEGEKTATVPVEMKVTVLKIMTTVSPQMSDAWVRENVPGFTSFEELESYVKDSILEQKREQSDAYKMKQVVDVLSKRLDGSLSDDFFESQYLESSKALDEALNAQGMTREQFYQNQQIDEYSFRMMTMLEIRDRFSQVFALDAYARKMGIEASDADIDEYLDALAENNNEEARRISEVSYKASLGEAVCRSKAMQALMADAKLCVK
jgi:trigger factor